MSDQSDILGTVKLNRITPCCVSDRIHAVAEECLVQLGNTPFRLLAAEWSQN